MADNDLVDHGKIHFLMDYVADNFPNVAKIKNQLTNDQCENLEAEFSRAEIIEVLEAMENHSNVTKKYMSVSLTLKNWIKIRKQNVKQQQQNGRSKPDFDDTIRKF
jgi:Cdc6-like AAA superfamily ATPase